MPLSTPSLRCLSAAAAAAALFIGEVRAAPVTFSDIQQARDPAGPASVPSALANELRLPTPVYQAVDDGVSMVDLDEAQFSFSFDVASAPGDALSEITLLQNMDFDFGAPAEASSYVRTRTAATVSYTSYYGVPVDAGEPENQLVILLDETFHGSDLPGAGSVSVSSPLPAGVTSLRVAFDNTLIASSVEDIAQIVARDFRVTFGAATVPEPGTALLAIAATACGRRRPRS